MNALYSRRESEVRRKVIVRRRSRARNMVALSASHRCAADSTSVLSTACKSKVERLITLSTSAVAVCCCKRFAQFVEQPRVLDGDDGLGGEVREQLDLLVSERADLLAIDVDRADQLVSLSIGTLSTVRAAGIDAQLRAARSGYAGSA